MNFLSNQILAKDWAGLPLSPPLLCAFKKDAHRITLSFARNAPAQAHPSSQSTIFYEGLWEYDVAEAFFLEPATGRYLEVNLAPNGAWWACWHSSIRVREQHQPNFDAIQTKAESHSEGWQAEIVLPKSLFTTFDNLHFNLTAILNSPQQTFHSLAELPGEVPDFHQPDSFLSQQGMLHS